MFIMTTYKAECFSVTLIWFSDSIVRKKKFSKYRDAVAWAEKNLDTELISVRILGLLKQKSEEL